MWSAGKKATGELTCCSRVSFIRANGVSPGVGVLQPHRSQRCTEHDHAQVKGSYDLMKTTTCLFFNERNTQILDVCEVTAFSSGFACLCLITLLSSLLRFRHDVNVKHELNTFWCSKVKGHCGLRSEPST